MYPNKQFRPNSIPGGLVINQDIFADDAYPSYKHDAPIWSTSAADIRVEFIHTRVLQKQTSPLLPMDATGFDYF